MKSDYEHYIPSLASRSPQTEKYKQLRTAQAKSSLLDSQDRNQTSKRRTRRGKRKGKRKGNPIEAYKRHIKPRPPTPSLLENKK